MRSIATAALLGLATATVSAAGTVNVSFVEPDKFFDAGTTKLDVPANLNVIEQHLKDLGRRYLADGQVLNISILDVDLAGDVRPSRRDGVDIRIAKGLADWPRFKVRYTLEANGTAVKSAEETLADLSYGHHVAQSYSYSSRDPLHHEKVMLESWFRARFTSDY